MKYHYLLLFYKIYQNLHIHFITRKYFYLFRKQIISNQFGLIFLEKLKKDKVWDSKRYSFSIKHNDSFPRVHGCCLCKIYLFVQRNFQNTSFSANGHIESV